MAKGTLFTLIILAIIATLLFGINLGKNLPINQNQPAPTTFSSPVLTFIPPITITNNVTKTLSRTTYTDKTCGFSFSYPGSYIRQKTVNAQSIILTDPDNPEVGIAATCAETVPHPSVAAQNKETITLDGVAGILYHDQDPNGHPRDIVIVTHAKKGKELVLASSGSIFSEILASFRFVQ